MLNQKFTKFTEVSFGQINWNITGVFPVLGWITLSIACGYDGYGFDIFITVTLRCCYFILYIFSLFKPILGLFDIPNLLNSGLQSGSPVVDTFA